MFDYERDLFMMSDQKPELKKPSLPSNYDILVIPDVHSYDRDKIAVDLLFTHVFDYISKEYNIKKVIQLGDLLECGEFSRYGQTNIQETIENVESELTWAVKEFWNPLKSTFDSSEMYFVEGNHEFRWHNYILSNIKKKKIQEFAATQFDPCTVFKNHGIFCTPYGEEDAAHSALHITDDLVAVHGWSHAKHAADAHLNKMVGSTSVIFGHTHRIQSFVRRDTLTGKFAGAWSFGALEKTGMYYQKGIPSDHALGFGLICVRGNSFSVFTIPIFSKDNSRKLTLPNGEYFEV